MAASAFNAGPPPFSPTAVTGLKAWWDFSDITTLFTASDRSTPVTANNDPIRGVTDKSGTSHHLSENVSGTTYKTNIQNGNSVARFSSTSNLRVASAVQTTSVYSIFIVLKFTTVSIPGVPVFVGDYGSGNGYGPVMLDSGPTRGVLHRSVAILSDGTGNTTTWEIWGTTRTAAPLVTFYLDGVSQSLSNSTASVNAPTGDTFVGSDSTDHFTGDIGEILIYDNAVGSTDRDDITSFLGTKWGVSV